MSTDNKESINAEVTYEFEASQDRQDESDENEEDMDKLHGHKRLHVIKKGKEREVKILLVVENFRLAFYIIFALMCILGYILTTQFVEEDYTKIIVEIFGVVSICVYFDFPPSTYVLPSIWIFALLSMEVYILVSIFRVWVAKEEDKVSRCYFVGYTLAMVYVGMSMIMFSIVLSVQPDLDKPATVRLHTLPYTNLTIAMGVLAIMITWFGEKVAWNGLGTFPGFSYINYMMLALQISDIPVMTALHINSVTDIGNGLWWDTHDSPTITIFIQIFNFIFYVSVIIWPIIQSAYLSYLREKTHCVYMVLMDNRKGKAIEEISN